MIEPLASIGAYFSFPGAFAHERKTRQRDTFRRVPTDRLLIETDAPDQVLPEDRVTHPLGQRLNHPANIAAVYEAAAELLGTDEAPPAQRPVGGSWWPVFAALGVGATAVGVVVHPAVFVTGICIVAAVAVEWTMTNWSEKVSGDAAHNAAQREKLVRPVEIPVLGTLGVGVLVLAVSRVLLASSVDGAVLVATVVGVVIFGGAIFISRNPSLPRGLVQGVLLLGFLAVIVAGIVTAATGEREFHHKGGGGHATETHAGDGH